MGEAAAAARNFGRDHSQDVVDFVGAERYYVVVTN
jgi:hypothetical protein